MPNFGHRGCLKANHHVPSSNLRTIHSFLRDTAADQDGSSLLYEKAQWSEHKAETNVKDRQQVRV
jgi:hypothetical protein